MPRQRPPQLSLLDALVEERVAAAQRAGAFDDLPGAGRPLAFDDEPLVPEELRMAYRILRNAGFVPPEVQTLRELRELERLIETGADDATRRRAGARLHLLLERASRSRGPHGTLQLEDARYRAAVERLLGSGRRREDRAAGEPPPRTALQDSAPLPRSEP
jgi:hypothetical protein